MMTQIDFSQLFLFETSWEVCNKVGGIYTVLKTKTPEVISRFGQNYLLIGPLLEKNTDFIESDDETSLLIKNTLNKENIECKTGFWDVLGKPRVVLIRANNRYNVDDVLYRLWTNFKVDSLASNFDYIEPVLFAFLAGEVINFLSKLLENKRILAHFHEWLCGSGVLQLKDSRPDIATIFTTHATVLGRAMASANIDIYNLPPSFDANLAAHQYGVYAKFSLEKAAAREANCFTTVSTITADECNTMLNRYVDKITNNGFDLDAYKELIDRATQKIPTTRELLINVAEKIRFNKYISRNSILIGISGRLEFHNKGFDVFLEAIANLAKRLKPQDHEIVVFVLAAAARRTHNESLLTMNLDNISTYEGKGISTHRIYNQHDPIIKAIHDFNLLNGDKINVIYSDAYLDGNDGVFNETYENILAALDLAVFPSYYEPWGYTPQESITFGVPTITTDLAGFGAHAKTYFLTQNGAITVLPYKGVQRATFIESLTNSLYHFVELPLEELALLKTEAMNIAKNFSWKKFFPKYLAAYRQAIEFNNVYKIAKSNNENSDVLVLVYHDDNPVIPQFRSFKFEASFPENVKRLRDLSYNLWWTWNRQVVNELFNALDAQLWKSVKKNIAAFVEIFSETNLAAKMNNQNFVDKYKKIIDEFDRYLNNNRRYAFCDYSLINEEHPIAYFCLEYGIDECLSIYSGGLGILAGDYLKTFSDMNLPLFAIGLFYKEGYFSQKITQNGEQIANYTANSPLHLPMQQVRAESGDPLLISIEILDRPLYVAVWEVKVGKIKLYLLDTNVDQNIPEDREITARLYDGSRECRLLQEIVLGIAGTRFITEHLKIEPAIYHLNEGHSAFLLIERLKGLLARNFTIDEAFEYLRSSSVFTTHTSVPAGNEVFSDDLITKYLGKSLKILGKDIKELLQLGKLPKSADSKLFSMTTLSMKFCLGINAVSEIHGKVARQMLKDQTTTLITNEIPIIGITNGVHLKTWLGTHLSDLYDKYLRQDWVENQDQKETWQQVFDIPDEDLYEAHHQQKLKLINKIKRRIADEYILRNESDILINNSIAALDQDPLIIGIARRFATYKRHFLILLNKQKLARLLTNKDKPVVLLVAGKAHPADTLGQKVVQSVIETMRDPIFKGHIIFIENYDIKIAKTLVQGVDVWLNTPIINTEACGTSGMKAALNGGLNFSIKDGWWAEAYRDYPKAGFAIENVDYDDAQKRNEVENNHLLQTLEDEIIPTFYATPIRNQNTKWIDMMKTAIFCASYQFNTQRMVKDYFEKLYVNVAKYSNFLAKNDYDNLKLLIIWKERYRKYFNSVKIKTVIVEGIQNGKIEADGQLKVKTIVFSGKMLASELVVQLVLKKLHVKTKEEDIKILEMKPTTDREVGLLTYELDYKLETPGFYSYGIRIIPCNDILYGKTFIEIWK